MFPVGRASVPAQIRAARDGRPTIQTRIDSGFTFSCFVVTVRSW